MKRTLLTLITGLSSLGLFAQCVPVDQFQTGGLELAPSPLSPVYTCVGCGDQSKVISLQTFADTTLSVTIQPGNPPLAVTVFADRFRLDSIAGLPAGLSYTTDAAFDTTYDPVENPFGYWVNPGDTATGFEHTIGCISIEGDEAAWNAAVGGGPNNDGEYPLEIYVDARAADFIPQDIAGVVGYNTWLTDMGVLLDAFGDPNFTVNGIRLQGTSLKVVQSGVGIEEQNTVFSQFMMAPNPATDAVTIRFENTDKTNDGSVLITATDGRAVQRVKTRFVHGQNRVVLDVSSLESGIYLLTLQSSSGTLSERLIVH